MPNVLDIFKADPSPFDQASLTKSINLVPNNYGRLKDGFFQPMPIETTSAIIEYYEGVVNLLPSKPRGAPGTLGTVGKRKAISVAVPHFPHDDSILADSFQNVRGFGTQDLERVADVVNRKLLTMRSKHDITLEWMRWGAIKGVVLDSDGTTEIVNLFDALNLTEEVQDFALDSDSTEILDKCMEVSRYIEANAKGLTYSGIRVFCSQTFFSALITHPIVKAAIDRLNDGNFLRSDSRRAFPFGGLTFEEHVGHATEADGTDHPFIPADEARVVLEGAPDFLVTYFAPGTLLSAVNQPGQPIYVSQEVMKHNAGVDIHTQSNPLPICTRPELLVKLTLT